MRCLAPPRLLRQPLAMAASLSSSRLSVAMAPEIFPCFQYSSCPCPSLYLRRISPDWSVCSPFPCSSSSSCGSFSTSSAGNQKAARAKICAASVVGLQESRRSAGSSKPPLPKSFSICPGCGIGMQAENPDAPGFFVVPRTMADEAVHGKPQLEAEGMQESADSRAVDALSSEEGDDVVSKDDDDASDTDTDEVDSYDEDEKEPSRKTDSKRSWTIVQLEPREGGGVQVTEEEPLDEKEWQKSLDGFRPAGPEYGRRVSGGDSGWNQVGGPSPEFGTIKEKKKRKDKDDQQERLLVCARCHQLRNYGKVHNEDKENLLPDFDFELTVGKRLTKTYATRTVVVMVVDSADFDGSFPRRAASLLTEVVEKEGASWKDNKSGNVPRLVLVANKIDLLPKQVSPIRLDHWIRRRAKEGGAPHLSALFLVSCLKNWGIKAVLQGIKDLAGPRGEVWVVGAQNAGKSSLINALSKVEQGAKLTQLTEAPVPGTTLGILRLSGILPAKAKLFDTPGLLHPHQVTVRLNREEQKMVQVRKELKPRTYRIAADNTLHIGGLARLDVKEISASSLYVTIWVSASLTCHLGRTKRAGDTFEKHVGVKLQPPLSKERITELGPWVQTPVTVTGDNWNRSSFDIAVAGLGWFAFGIKGTANVDVWTYEGVAITTRSALVPDMAHSFGETGFTS